MLLKNTENWLCIIRAHTYPHTHINTYIYIYIYIYLSHLFSSPWRWYDVFRSHGITTVLEIRLFCSTPASHRWTPMLKQGSKLTLWLPDCFDPRMSLFHIYIYIMTFCDLFHQRHVFVCKFLPSIRPRQPMKRQTYCPTLHLYLQIFGKQQQQ